ncbi:MAG: PVC-type heme-binding CxxCH protein [Rhodothermales bacterium]
MLHFLSRTTLFVFALLILSPAAHAFGYPPLPENLVAQPIPNKMGLQLHEFSFSWSASDQQSYQILVASNEQKLAADVGDLWDSGRRYTGQHDAVRYLGTALPAGATVWWKVRLWGVDGSEGGYSEPARLDVGTSEAIAAQDGQIQNRVAFIGGTLISRMEKYGYLETAITANWPMHDITFRNLGWPGDDVMGTARGEFGSLRNTRSWRPPTEEEGVAFQVLMDHVNEAKPAVMIVGYGNEAAFAESEADFDAFKANYERLISQLEKTGATLTLLTPAPHCEATFLHDPTARNERLARASAFISSVATAKNLTSVDLFSHILNNGCIIQDDDSDSFSAMYDANGIHLNEYGYQKITRFLSEELGFSGEGITVDFDASGAIKETRGVRLADVQPIAEGVRFSAAMDKLPAPWEAGEITLGLEDAPHHLKINGELMEDYAAGFSLSPGHLQFEAVREIVVEKSKFHRAKMRPLNLAYIYLFRRHEMGHLAHESDDLDALVAGHEQVIENLRIANVHRYEIQEVENWQAPRVYPDHEVPQYVPEPNIAEELAAFTLSDSLEINLFSSDPLIANPINLSWDTRGRAWVSTSSTYPHLKPGDEPNDRIVILEDWDQDGVADTAKVFAEGFLVPHSVMPVEGGAYVASSTELIFLADHDGDDVADERRVVYAGFGNADVHHMIHGLRWAPWGDLYFTQSIYINSFIETAYGNRRLNGSGVWYFRPETEQLEIYSRGMTNPWGFAFDEWGQSFATDGAGGAGPHYAFPGAKHPTAVGAHRVLSGLIPGKPKNTAAEFISGRHMPEEWHGSLLANDYRANRMVRYVLAEDGSGYTAHEAQTMLHSSHRSFRPVDIKMGPDGAAYVVDWYNPIIDHGEVDFYHPLRDRSHGRIWRLTAKNRPTLDHPEIAGSTIPELLELLKAPEQYTREQANRELASLPADAVAASLTQWVKNLDRSDSAFEHHRLEAGWLYMAINRPDVAFLASLLDSPSYEVRAAATRMLAKVGDETFATEHLERAIKDAHPQVRLEAVNALRALNTPASVNLAMRALDLPMDNDLAFALELTVRDLREQWVPAMLAAQPVFDDDREKILYALLEVNDARVMGNLLALVKHGIVKEQDVPKAIRLITSLGNASEVSDVLTLAKSSPAFLKEMAASASASAAVPPNGDEVASFFSSTNTDARIAAIQLAGVWRVEKLVPDLVDLAGSSDNPTERQAVTEALAQMNAVNALKGLMASDDSSLRAAAVAAWGQIAPDEAAQPAINLLATLDGAGGSAPIIATTIDAFLSTDDGVAAFKDALSTSSLPEEVAVAGIRAVRASGRYMGDLVDAFSTAGALKPVAQNMTPEERRALLSEMEDTGDIGRGRSVYSNNTLQCNNCHVVDGNGDQFGPDLTSLGSYMTPASILESLLNPGTDIKQGYETVLVRKTDNSIVSGLLQRETDDATLIRIPGGTVISIPNGEIAKIENSPYSLMPAGLTASIRRDELVDLMKYLSTLGKEQ